MRGCAYRPEFNCSLNRKQAQAMLKIKIKCLWVPPREPPGASQCQIGCSVMTTPQQTDSYNTHAHRSDAASCGLQMQLYNAR